MNNERSSPDLRIKQVLECIRGLSLIELAPLIRHIAEMTYALRTANAQKNLGGVPLEVFEWLLGMSGVSVSVQIVNEVWTGDEFVGFALKQRESAEAGDAWANLYHSTCCTFRMYDTPQTSLTRNLKETVDEDRAPAELATTEFLGVTIHDEPERRSSCVTMMHRRKVTLTDCTSFSGTWKIFRAEDVRERDPRIIDHNWFLLQWVLDPNRPPFADVRNGWPQS